MPDFDPLNPLMSFLLGYDSDVVRDVLYRTGVPANFELNERERFSHRIRPGIILSTGIAVRRTAANAYIISAG